MILEIFKAGTHTDSKGRTKTYSENDLDKIVSSYKPGQREAPLVLGHPKDNDPAYGWVEKLFRKGKSLFAKTKDEDPRFLKAVKERRFPKRSVSLTEDLRLNHIGFLGAAIPAVDGLAEISFNADDQFSVIELPAPPTAREDKLNFEFEEEHNSGNSGPGDEDLQKDKSENHMTLESANNKNNSLPGSDSGEDQPDYSYVLNNISETLNKVKAYTETFSENLKLNNYSNLNDKEKKKIREQLEYLNTKLNINNFEVLLNEKLLYGSLTPAMKEKITKTLRYISSQNFSEVDRDKFIIELKSQLLEFINSIPKIVTIQYSPKNRKMNPILIWLILITAGFL